MGTANQAKTTPKAPAKPKAGAETPAEKPAAGAAKPAAPAPEGAGNDTMTGGADSVSGGNDTVAGGDGADTIVGGAGDGASGPGADSVSGGDDTVTGSIGGDTVAGGADSISGGGDSVSGGADNAGASPVVGADLVAGSTGGEVIQPTPANSPEPTPVAEVVTFPRTVVVVNTTTRPLNKAAFRMNAKPLSDSNPIVLASALDQRNLQQYIDMVNRTNNLKSPIYMKSVG